MIEAKQQVRMQHAESLMYRASAALKHSMLDVQHTAPVGKRLTQGLVKDCSL